MGTWTAISFSPAQQEQFGVNESGEVQDQAKFDAAIAALKAPAAAAAAPAGLPKLAVAEAEALRALRDPIIIDARDQDEEHPTTTEEYQKKLLDAGVLPDDKGAAIITHCGNGGRGGRAAAVLRELGYPNAHNGGSPDNIRKARAAS
ncbi:unnamed protein product [Prorocentrum cordatum]|uniref:Rhodanese domain-containing protein n=1 Tax=Prorocentrum cordatum TaxID=2364126 RepID=A0ABN9SS55_9DINO|nr:unnamed protein product [Polarella glacialis]